MDRSRYYSPEELYDRSLKRLQYGLALEYAPGLYENIDTKQVLRFVSVIVSKYHVNLHDEDEIDVPMQTEPDNITLSLTNPAIEVQMPEVLSDDDREYTRTICTMYGNKFQVGGHYPDKLAGKNRKNNTKNKHKVDFQNECDERNSIGDNE